MTAVEQIQALASVLAIVMSGATAYLVYRGSDKASQRTQAAQTEQNTTDRFDRLTQRQDDALEREYERAQAADERARAAEEYARAAKRSADEAQRIAEACQLQQAATVEAYRELRQWAALPCPHPQPPPQPPLRLAFFDN
jgi:peptidoglycan hydrolase CwlO-like protein